MNSHFEPIARAQRNQSLQLYILAGRRREAAALRQAGQDEPALHAGKAFSNAQARPTSEGNIRKARTGEGEMPGVESIRILPESGVAVDCIRAEDEQGI